MDEYGLLKFDTLHEMNRNAVLAFAPNDLFGTYSNNGDDNIESSSSTSEKKKSVGGGGGGGFEWITYEGWGRKVDVCREVLRDLGESIKGNKTKTHNNNNNNKLKLKLIYFCPS